MSDKKFELLAFPYRFFEEKPGAARIKFGKFSLIQLI
jgi:hypothetical protein